jgi:hypothetical protein
MEWHTLENGLCFYRLPSGRLCNNKAVKKVRTIEGDAHGIYCKKHYDIAVREWATAGANVI